MILSCVFFCGLWGITTKLSTVHTSVSDGAIGLETDSVEISLPEKPVDSLTKITISFSDGPGDPADWIGVYLPGQIPGTVASTAWLYSNGTRTAGGNKTKGEIVFPPDTLTPGRYDVWFLTANGYRTLAGPLKLEVRAPKVKPGWVVSSFRRVHGVVGIGYSGKISAYANSPDHAFTKVTGPAWLSVSENGMLTGSPGSDDVGNNTFTVRVSDGEEHQDARLLIQVFRPGKEEVSELKVMTYNAWVGWSRMTQGDRKGLASIIRSDADLIGMQECGGSFGRLPKRLAADLGWHYRDRGSGSLGILSRYPLSDAAVEAGGALGARIRLSVSPKREVVLFNCHLDPHHYGPYTAQKKGATVESVMAEELASRRDEQIDAIIKGMSLLLEGSDRLPVFLTGDFNAPSHLDWTKAASKEHDGVFGVPWPTSTQVTHAGMIDSYREANPDPVRKPGNTWSPVFQGDEPQDRIDLVYYKGKGVKTVSSKVFTMPVEVTLGRETRATSAVRNNTWPSDHAAVLSVFRLSLPVDE